MIDYIPYPERLYLEIYHLLYPDEEDDDAGDSTGGFDLDLDDL